VSKLSPDQWREISPLLDEALSLSDDQCEAWLQSLTATKPNLIGLLRELLEENRALSQERFLELSAPAPELGAYLRDQTVGPYTLVSPIGQGGMGRVWLAERSDGRFERRVAIKFLQFSVATRAGAERFRREGRILGSLTHPHIAELIDAGVMPDGQPYMVLEYVEGESINQYCDARALDVNARIRLFLDVLAALAHAHASLIVHRDIKPSNVLVSKDGQVKLLDFGIAKLLAHEEEDVGASSLTLEAGAALTPQFAAPEQVTGGAITTATDVYAAGILLYLLLTGQHPAGPEPYSTANLIKAIVELDPPRPSDALPSHAAAAESEKRSTTPERLRRQLRGDLETIILKALKKSPRERYGSVAEFSDDLRRHLNHKPVGARPDTLTYRTVKFARRNQLAVTLGALVVIATIIGLVGTLMQARTARRERDAALRQRDRADRIANFMTGIFKVADPRETADQTATARGLLDKADEDINQDSTLDPRLRAQLLHVMGRAYLNLGLFSRAESLFRQGIQASKSFQGQEDRDTLNMTHDLAWAVMQQGRLTEAEGIERPLLETQRRVLGPNDGDTLATMEELAFTVCNEGKAACTEGIELTRKVLEQQERSLGPDARYTLVTMDDLAIMLASANRLDEALQLEQDSLDRHIRVFGPKNLDTVSAMLNLGEFQRDVGHEDDAERTFEKLLEIENRFLGPDQLETAVTKYDLASVLVRNGRKEEAFPLIRQALEHGLAPRIAQGLPTDPLFASLHNDPHFKALIAIARRRFQAQSSPGIN
jgi:serine/threonine protein kinase/tetratricopeptide (TPR) repeat protein